MPPAIYCASGRTSLRAATGKGVAQILCHSRVA
jgi:hypothetical protein